MQQKYLFLFFIIVLGACTPNHKFFKDGANWIPPDFNPSKGVLLIVTYPGKEGWNSDMTDFVEKHYGGKYEVVDEKTIKSDQGKYADKDVYRYAILWRINNGKSSSTHNYYSPSTITTVSYSDPQLDWYGHFFDRQTGKEYSETRKINNYGRKGYIPFFNSIERFAGK